MLNSVAVATYLLHVHSTGDMVHNRTFESNAGPQHKDYMDEKENIAKQLIAIEEIRTKGEIEDITIKVRVWRLFKHIA